MNKVIVFQEKSSNRYFDASTQEAILRAFYTVLKERLEGGWYGLPSKPSAHYLADLEESAAMDDAVFATLPTALQKMVENDRNKLATINEEIQEQTHWFGILQDVIALPIDEAVAATMVVTAKSTKPRLALPWLYSRIADHQYEEYSIENIETP